MKLSTEFTALAHSVSKHVGHPMSFFSAVLIVLIWAITGPYFKYSDTWQLVVNTGTTIITFLMVFLIQATQNRDTTAIQLKLDELLRAVKGARNSLIDLDCLEESELDSLLKEYRKLAHEDHEEKKPKVKTNERTKE